MPGQGLSGSAGGIPRYVLRPVRRRQPWVGQPFPQGSGAQFLPRPVVARPATPPACFAGRVYLGRVPTQGRPAALLPRVLVAGRRTGPAPGVAVAPRVPRASPVAGTPGRLMAPLVVLLRRPVVPGRVVFPARPGTQAKNPVRAFNLAASRNTALNLPARDGTRPTLGARDRTALRMGGGS